MIEKVDPVEEHIGDFLMASRCFLLTRMCVSTLGFPAPSSALAFRARAAGVLGPSCPPTEPMRQLPTADVPDFSRYL